MDLSALIFVALAAAWAVYLVPKALKAHETDSLTRGVDRFSDRMRVLARREAVSASQAALVIGDDDHDDHHAADAAVVADTAEAAARPADRADEAPTAAGGPPEGRGVGSEPRQVTRLRIRRRVLGFILVVNLAVIGVVIAGRLPWPYVAAPAATLVTWLVMCRLMVRRERAVRAPQSTRKRRTTLADQAIAEEDAAAADNGPSTEEIPVVAEAPVVEGGWDPVPITLPTYVGKAPAGRTVRTIDLDATGVWSSGRNAADSQLAREAAQAEQSEALAADERRATGS